MKKTLILIAAAILAVGCDQQRQASNDNSTTSDKSDIRRSVRQAKSEVDKQARAQKEILDSEAKAAQAQIDAEKARAKAAATDAQAKVDAASQNIREAAGSASAKAQSEVGVGKSATVPPTIAPPAESGTAPTTPAPTTPADTSTPDDQKLAEQVRTAINAGTVEATADAAKNIQVSASGGTVTLKGTVKTPEEKTRIEMAAKAVSGVTKVDNQLEVKAE
jgi:hyperosmotically inducible periplasmic protein